MPPLGAHLWAWFRDLHDTRSSAGMGPARLSRLEIRAWEDDEGRRLSMWERRTLMAIDAEWFRTVSEDIAKRSSEGGKK